MSYAVNDPEQNAQLPKHELIGLYLGGREANLTKRVSYLEEKVRQLVQANEDGTTGGLPFNPTDLVLPVRLWMDASEESTVTANSSNRVTSWRAKVGGLTLGNDDADKSPSYNSTTLNGLKTLSFDGDDFLQSTANLNVVSSNQTWYLLFKATAVDSAQDALFTYGEDYENGNWQLTSGDSTSFRGRVWKDVPPYTYPPFLSNDNLVNEWHLFTIEFDRENKTISAFIDGTEVLTDHADPYPLNNNGIFKLFRNRAGTNSPAGEVAEFMIQPTKNDENRELIEYHIMEKWGLLSNLDDSNQYKDGTVEPSGGGSDDGQYIEDRQQTITNIQVPTASNPNVSGMALRISSVDGGPIIDPTRPDDNIWGTWSTYRNPQKFYGGIRGPFNYYYDRNNQQAIGTFWDIRGTYIKNGKQSMNSYGSPYGWSRWEFKQVTFADGLNNWTDLNDAFLPTEQFTNGQSPIRFRYQRSFASGNDGLAVRLEIRSASTFERVMRYCRAVPMNRQGNPSGPACSTAGTVTEYADIELYAMKPADADASTNKMTFYSQDGFPVTGEFGPNAIVEHWDGSDWFVALPNPSCDYTTEELAKIPAQYRSLYSTSGNGSCLITANPTYVSGSYQSGSYQNTIYNHQNATYTPTS